MKRVFRYCETLEGMLVKYDEARPFGPTDDFKVFNLDSNSFMSHPQAIADALADATESSTTISEEEFNRRVADALNKLQIITPIKPVFRYCETLEGMLVKYDLARPPMSTEDVIVFNTGNNCFMSHPQAIVDALADATISSTTLTEEEFNGRIVAAVKKQQIVNPMKPVFRYCETIEGMLVQYDTVRPFGPTDDFKVFNPDSNSFMSHPQAIRDALVDALECSKTLTEEEFNRRIVATLMIKK